MPDSSHKVPLSGGITGTIEVPGPIIAPIAAKVGDKNIPPQTTAEQDVMTAGQRRVNLIWECTQALVALIVTVFTLWVAARLAVTNNNEAAFLLLSNVFFMVVSTYFARTNHTRTGGVQTGDTGR